MIRRLATWAVTDVVRPFITGAAIGLGIIGAFGIVEAIGWWIR